MNVMDATGKVLVAPSGDGRIKEVDDSSIRKKSEEIRKDFVEISGDAYKKWVDEKNQSTDATEFWKSYFGYEREPQQQGVSRTISLSGNDIEVLEYHDGRLRKKIAGTFYGDKVTTSTEIYNAKGDLAQKVDATLTGLEDKTAWTTTGKVKRDIQWFGTDGNVVREMKDSMELRSSYTSYKDLMENIGSSSLDPDAVDGMQSDFSGLTLNDLRNQMTFDSHMSKYSAVFYQYEEGVLRKSVSLSMRGDYLNLTNRTEDEQEGVGAFSTAEQAHATELSLSVTDYDKQGRVMQEESLRESEHNSKESGDGEMKQHYTLARYNEGTIVERSSGEFAMKESKGGSFGRRPSILDTLATTQDEYASTVPQSASQLLARENVGFATEADHFGYAFNNSAQADTYNAARRIAEFGENQNPYSISWTTENYVDGKLAARKVDEERAVTNPAREHSGFRTGGGLTEDARPQTVHSSNHVEESYQNGMLNVHAELNFSEYIREDAHGADVIRTHASGWKNTGLTRRRVDDTIDAPLYEADRDGHAASYAMGRVLDRTLTGMHSLFAKLDYQEYAEPEQELPEGLSARVSGSLLGSSR
ncbi:MAG: hypothetical protein ACK5JO_10870 [Halodesulfovibrio sp.]